ncbi:type II toxin-antitoxin system VapC family toxin [Microbacterium sp. SA39]|uniref:type II toxin-antitoxin system VapC family toxin n=1 Tax=Microbacterium sp. SA39 TaxID=1263625 RepID=UPI0005FA3C75|nr:type II toxin-antitoxin system VapC family toxin [Microbacterium sp. SA39]KJQ54184.1 Ribonuclease VapC28 [Microbacterium sp. SA39]
MIVDSSVFLAILLNEPESEQFRELLKENPVAVSAATVAESRIVLQSRGGTRLCDIFEAILIQVNAGVIPVDGNQARLASDAYQRFGRGSGSRARLNYGDCFSYALAITRDEPLLFKGDDFIHTDVRRVPSGR